MSKKLRNLLLSIPTALLLAFGILQVLVYFWIRPVLNAVFKESVSYYSSGIYSVSYEQMQLKPLQQKVAFRNFMLAFDSSRVAGTDSLRHSKWVTLSLDDFELSLDNFWTMVPSRYLKVNNLLVSNPQLKIFDFKNSTEQKRLNLEKLTHFDAHALISEYFDSLDVQSLHIGGAQLSWIGQEQNSPFTLANINADVSKLRIDSSTVLQNYGYPRADQFDLSLKNASFFSRDSLYLFHLGEVRADPVKQQLSISDFSMSPQKPIYEFARSVGHQVDRVQITVKDLSLDRIDLHYLLTEQAFLVGMIRILRPELHVFKDKRLRKPTATAQPLLQEALRQVPFAFRLDTLQLMEGSIYYREHVAEAQQPGSIYFDQLYVSGYNITNLDSLSKEEMLMEADVETNFMGESLLKLSLDVPLDVENGFHRIRGEMHDLPLHSLNNMLENTAFTSVRSGFAYTFSFDMHLDKQQAQGDLHFAYRDLKIDLLNKEEPGQQGLKENIGSLLANWVVVKTNNPDNHRKPLRIGEVSFKREPEKSVFNYWWKSLLSGIKGSVGLGEHHSSDDSQSAENEKPGLLKRIFNREKSGK